MAKVTLIDRKDGQGGVFSPQEVIAQQALPTVQAVPVVAWDHRNGQYGILNQGFLAEVCVLAERMSVIGRVVAPVTVTVPDDAVVGDEFEGVITVPDGMLWFLNQLTVVMEAADATGSTSFNIGIDLGGGVSWDYFPLFQAHAVLTTIDLPDLDQLGTPLRLVAGNKVILKLRTTVDSTAEKDVVLTAFGNVAKRLV